MNTPKNFCFLGVVVTITTLTCAVSEDNTDGGGTFPFLILNTFIQYRISDLAHYAKTFPSLRSKQIIVDEFWFNIFSIKYYTVVSVIFGSKQPLLSLHKKGNKTRVDVFLKFNPTACVFLFYFELSCESWSGFKRIPHQVSYNVVLTGQ